MTHRSDDVLQDYLNDLLGAASGDQSPPETPEGPSQSAPEPVVARQEKTAEPALASEDPLALKRAELQRLLHSARLQVEQVVDTEPAPSVEPTIELTEPPSAPIEADEVMADSLALSVLEEQLQWLENGRPRWAQETFEVLLFKVSGLTLAVPLMSLGQIQPLTDELTPLFGQADWFMGLQPTPAGKVRTVNTAKFVMPERYDPAFVDTAKYVISINGVPWGLAVDTVEQPISLDPDDVKWRSARTQRPWLAGTVKAQMCALLDIPMMGKLLTDADKNAKRAQR